MSPFMSHFNIILYWIKGNNDRVELKLDFELTKDIHIATQLAYYKRVYISLIMQCQTGFFIDLN